MRSNAAKEIEEESVETKPKGAIPPQGFPDKWALIKMHPRRDENEVQDIVPCVEGRNISIQRGKWSPVNWAYVECLRHASHPKYSQEPGQQRVKIGEVERFPFQGPYEITPEQFTEFMAIIKDGREITENDIRTIAGISV